MGVETRSVILIGADYSDLTWDNLTEKGQQEVISEVISDSPIDEDELEEDGYLSFEEQAEEYYNDNKSEILTDWFDFDHIANIWIGQHFQSGIEVGQISLKADYAQQIAEFKQWFNLEPDLHNGVLTY